MAKPIYFCNGRYVSADQARIFVHDLGLIRGFGLFESVRTYGGKPFLLEGHLKRLFDAATQVGLKPALNRNSMARVIGSLLRKNDFDESLIRIILTGGLSSGFLPQGRSTLIILADRLHPFPARQYKNGIELMSTPLFRIHPEIKSTVYFSAVVETMRAARRGFDEVVYVDKEGAILEGTTFSVFAVLPGPRLVTPKDGVLPGITAECVIQLARRLKIPVERHPISPRMLRQARELFITSSNRELIPAVRVDRLKIGNGKPGPVTRQLHQVYRFHIQAAS